MTNIFQKGTLEEFNLWHNSIKEKININTEGKIGLINGIPAPNNQRTYSYSEARKGINSELYMWNSGEYPISGKEQLTLKDFEDFTGTSVSLNATL